MEGREGEKGGGKERRRGGKRRRGQNRREGGRKYCRSKSKLVEFES